MKSSDITTVLNDRIIVKKLGPPEKIGQFFVPENASNKVDRQTLWKGEVVKFGLDTNADLAYNLAVGDIVAIEPVGQDCATKQLEDGEFVWVPQEFIAAKEVIETIISP